MKNSANGRHGPGSGRGDWTDYRRAPAYMAARKSQKPAHADFEGRDIRGFAGSEAPGNKSSHVGLVQYDRDMIQASDKALVLRPLYTEKRLRGKLHRHWELGQARPILAATAIHGESRLVRSRN